jgi:dipeptidyl aminopeptidase/acylaminoacyl peptidase
VRNLVPALAELSIVDETRIAMMGHSMGAGLTLQTLATMNGILAAALLGAVTGREAERYDARLNRWSHGSGAAARGLDTFSERYGTPESAPESFERMSVINYLDAVAAPVIMHHGSKDEICPVEWATAIRDELEALQKHVAFYLYTDAGHVFRDDAFEAMIERTDRFFRAHMDLAS